MLSLGDYALPLLKRPAAAQGTAAKKEGAESDGGEESEEEEEEDKEDGEEEEEETDELSDCQKLSERAGSLLTAYQMATQRMKGKKRAAPLIADILAAGNEVSSLQKKMMQTSTKDGPAQADVKKLNGDITRHMEASKILLAEAKVFQASG